MKIVRFSIIMLITVSTVIQSSPYNSSFKIGMPVSTFEIMFGDKNYQGKNLTPLVGIGYFSTSTKRDGSSDDYDYSIKFLLPRLGTRIMGSRIGDLNYYYLSELFLVIPFVSGSDISSSDEKEIKDELNLLGVTLGWGVEHYFSDSFSIGGEFSFNWIYHSVERESYDYDYNTYTETSSKYDMITTLSATMTQLTFNYYFK